MVIFGNTLLYFCVIGDMIAFDQINNMFKDIIILVISDHVIDVLS